MALPTVQSSGDALKDRFNRVNGAMQQARAASVKWKATLAAGDTAIKDILDGIYIPFVEAAGYWRTVDLDADGRNFRNYYREQLSHRIEFDATPSTGDVNATTDRITLDGNKFAVSDPVEIIGPGTAMTGLVKGTNYRIFDKQGQGCSFKTQAGETKINISDDGAGVLFIQRRVGADFTALVAALEAVIDEVESAVPVTPTTLEIRALKFDKTLASSASGLSDAVLTSVQTATLQTKLQDVVDEILAPA